MNDGLVPEMDYQALNEVEEGKKGDDKIHLLIRLKQAPDNISTNCNGYNKVEKPVGKKPEIENSQQHVHHHAGGTQRKQYFQYNQAPDFPAFFHILVL